MNNIGTGAGHGAPGGSSASSVKGGSVYDPARLPTEQGSGGGSTTTGAGGAGGGYLKIYLWTELQNEGRIFCSCQLSVLNKH